MLRLLLLLVAVVFNLSDAKAQGTAPNGCAISESGAMVCTTEPNTGTVNNNPVTLNPNNCGYVNGVYGCYGDSGVKDTSPASGTSQAASVSNTPGAPVTQNCGFGDIACVASAFSSWVSNELLYVPRKVFEWLGSAVGNLISSITPPTFVTDAKNALGNIPSGVMWFLNLMQFKYGLTIVMGALAARFLRRFIPLP